MRLGQKGAGKAGSGPVCPNCKGKGHGGEACTSKGGGNHVPKGKGKGEQPNFFGGKGGKGKGKGKGWGNDGRISEFDDAGWAHVAAAPEWNWASAPGPRERRPGPLQAALQLQAVSGA